MEARKYQSPLPKSFTCPIYIACTNSFGRPLKIKNGIYLSTHRNGSGIGLQSIQVSAAGYGGIARFSHEDGEFYSEVMLPLT